MCKAPKSASAPGPPGSHYLCALVGMCLVSGAVYMVFGAVYLVFGVIGLEFSVMYMLFRAASFPLPVLSCGQMFGLDDIGSVVVEENN